MPKISLNFNYCAKNFINLRSEERPPKYFIVCKIISFIKNFFENIKKF